MNTALRQSEQDFLQRFDPFWKILTTFERSHEHLSLDPRMRYWIDTYPPTTIWESDQAGRWEAPLDIEQISRETREDLFSLYFHIGFCRRRCAYCRQYELRVIGDADRSDLLRTYVETVKRDVDVSLDVVPALKAQTRAVYFGGGTPSVLPVAVLGSLLEHLFKRVDLSCLSEDSTFELHPDDDSDALLSILEAAEIPRVSVGVQTFDDRTLHSLGRRGSCDAILRMLDRVSERGFRTNIDIINGFVSHQDLSNWAREISVVESLLARGLVQSVTVYMLHPFPGTILHCDSGDAYWQTRNMCFAREYLCERLGLHERPIHWFHTRKPEDAEALAPTFSIFGYGNSSYSCLGPWLLENMRSLEAYLAHSRDGSAGERLPVAHCYRLTPAQLHTRALLFAIRSGAFKLGRHDLDRIGAEFEQILDNLVRDGLMMRSDELYRLTEIGKVFAHQIPIAFFDADIRGNFECYLGKRFGGAPMRSRPRGTEGV